MDHTALNHMRQCVRILEANPNMRKGVLVDAVLRDTSIQWDVIFHSLHLRGRHRAKLRWRRAVIQEAIRRPFLRGGARRSAVPSSPQPPPQPLNRAPWFIDIRELDAFRPQEVWDRFRTVFPVLAVYRSGWVASSATANAVAQLPPDAWASVWRTWRATVEDIAHALDWPPAVVDVAALLVPFARRLWPDEPWEHWTTPPGAVARGAVPYLRRVACRSGRFIRVRCICVNPLPRLPSGRLFSARRVGGHFPTRACDNALGGQDTDQKVLGTAGSRAVRGGAVRGCEHLHDGGTARCYFCQTVQAGNLAH